MSVDILLEQFNQLAETSGAIPTLRQFVLDLAVRGLLVPQAASDTPASELLQTMEQGKNRLVHDGVIRNPRMSPARTTEPPPFDVPLTWRWCRLSDIGAVVGGGTPASGNPAYFTDGGSGIAWLTPADLGKHKGAYITHGARDLTAEGLKNSSATLMPAGSVVFSSRAPIGYTAIAANPISTNQGFKSIVPFVPSCSRYIAVFFRAFATSIDAAASGTTFREVSGKTVGELWFPLPPLAEQQRIVTRVDELLALCDELEAAQVESEKRRDAFVVSSLYHLAPDPEDDEANDPAQLARNAGIVLSEVSRITTGTAWHERFRRAIVDLAVAGRITARGEDSPVEQTLGKVLQEKQAAAAGGLVRRPSKIVYSTPEPFTRQLPSGWTRVTLDSLCLSLTDGDHQPPPKTSDGIPFLVIGNVRNRLVDRSGCRFVSTSYYDGLDWSHRPRPRDILYTLVGSYGIPVVVRDDETFCVQRHIAIIRPAEAVVEEYLALVLEGTQAYRYATSIATGIAQKTVSLKKLREMPVPLPPIEEQRRIVEIVSDRLAQCEALANSVELIAEHRRALLSSLIAYVLQ